MNRVEQRTNYDCGICALAMATGESYERIADLIPNSQQRGVTNAETVHALFELGHDSLHLMTIEGLVQLNPGLDPNSFLAPNQKRVREAMAGHVAIVSVNGVSGEPHAVVVKNGVVYDPAKFRQVPRELGPSEIVLDAVIMR